MKKTITTALAALAFFGASAADMTVYNNGQLAEGVEAIYWWNASYSFATENPTGGDSKVFSMKATDGGTNASMGLLANGTQAVTGPLHSATLTFSWYAKAPATYAVRLTADTGKEQDYTWTVTEDDINKWNEVSLSVATDFPDVAAQWNDYVGKGRGYVFGVVLTEGQAESEIFFDNIRYEGIDEAWKAPAGAEIVPPTTVPAIAQDRTDVLPVFCAYGAAPFNIGWWDQATESERVTIDGTEVMKLSRFNYLGWELSPVLDASGYTYMHVDFYPCEETDFGFTPISQGPQEKTWKAPEVKVNEWNAYDVPLTYFSNVNLADVFQIKFDQGNNGAECYLANVYFWKKQGGEDPIDPDPVVPGAIYKGSLSGSVEQSGNEYPYTLNYSVTYNEDKTLTITADYVFTQGEPFGMIPGYVYINNMENAFVLDGATRKLTTTATYEPNAALELRFYVPAGAAVTFENTVNYKAGESNFTTSAVGIENAESVAEYYTLQGVRVQNPEKGLYIKVTDGKAVKVIF